MVEQRDIYAKQTLGIKLLTFIVFPFISFLYSLRQPNSKSSQIIFFLFGMLYAWSMDTHIAVYDFSRVSTEFYSQNLTTEELLEEISLFFVGESHLKEFYMAIIIWFVQLFSDNYHMAYLVASIPFLYFMLKSLKLITNDKLNYSNSLYSFVVIILFILPFDIFQLSNYRFPTAAWLAIYAVINIFRKRELKYYLLLCIAPFVHSGFWLLVLFVIIYQFIPKRIKLFEIIFYISIPFAFIETNLLSLINFSFLPDYIAEWANAYLSEEMISRFGMYRQGSGFYLVEIFIRKSIVLAFVVGVIISIKKYHKNQIIEFHKQNFFCFIVLFFSMVNFLQIVPTLGERYLRIVEIFFVYHWFSCFSLKPYRNYIFLIFAPTLYIILYEKFRYYMDTLDYSFFVSNVFSIISQNWGITSYKAF